MTHASPSHEQDCAPFDVLLAGMVFFDIVYTGFPSPPAPGQEVWTEGMGSAPGGIANLAVATARLGLHTGLVAGFSTDVYGEWMQQVLSSQEHINLDHSRVFADWHTPVTVSMAYDGDRAMVTHGHPHPQPLAASLTSVPATRSVVVDLGDPDVREATWWREAAGNGALVFADAGWDPSQTWDRAVLDALDGVHAFTPNAGEAMGYTRTGSPAAALSKLAELVPLAVVTDGANGVIAIDQTTGEQAHVPALIVEATDPTGAGDVFCASLTLGTLSGWPLDQRLRFAALCSALTVQQSGGSLAAPGWGDVFDWWLMTKAAADAGDTDAARTADLYAFLDGAGAGMPSRRVRRAEATIASFSDADIRASEPPTLFYG